jgi:hypothetical protein
MRQREFLGVCTGLGHGAVTCRYPGFKPTKCAHLVGSKQIASCRGEMIRQSPRNVSVRIETWDIGCPCLVKENIACVFEFRRPREIPHAEGLWAIPVLNRDLEILIPRCAPRVICGFQKPAVACGENSGIAAVVLIAMGARQRLASGRTSNLGGGTFLRTY